MGMSIEDIIQGLKETYMICCSVFAYDGKKYIDGAIDRLHKYQMMQADYEARLKADMVAMLTEIQMEIEECIDGAEGSAQFEQGVDIARNQVIDIIQEKISKLKENAEYKEPTTKNDLGVSSELEKNSKKLEKNFGELDCISREATVKRLCNLAEYMNEHKENSGDPYIMAALFIQDNKTEFPSVTPQEPRWIPVSERLPDTNIYDGHGPVWKQEVLITGYLSFDDKKETFVNMAFAEDVRNKCVPNTNVTAWMPLPKPYEQQESEG